MNSSESRKVRVLLGYISGDLEDIFTNDVAIANYEVKAISFKDPRALLDNAKWADAIFIQWDGRGQLGHDLISRLTRGSGPSKTLVSVYAVTSSKIKIEILNLKSSKQAKIAGWFDLPTQTDLLLKELALLIPDGYDHFAADLINCGLPLMAELPLESLAGKHLLGTIKSAWDERLQRSKTATRIKDEVLRSHVTFFTPDDARSVELKNFLTSIQFKYHDDFSDLTSCFRWIRGHSTDCLVVWYDAKSLDSETLIRMYTENRGFRRIPIIVLYPTENVHAHFKKCCQDLFVDKVLHFDRNREKFRVALVEAIETLGKEHGARRLLDEMRQTSLEFQPETSRALTPVEVDLACTEIELDPGKTYWAATEKLLALVRLKDLEAISTSLETYEGKYSYFDSALTSMVVRSGLSKKETENATRDFIQKMPFMKDVNFDRMVRASIVLSRLGASDPMKTLLILWWQSKDKYPASHEFYWAASRLAFLEGFVALERSLLALAIKLEPLRNDYVEAYLNHLIATNHPSHAIDLGEYLQQSDYFPRKKAMLIVFNAMVKKEDLAGGAAILTQMILKWPTDKYLAGLKPKVGLR